MKYLLFLFTSIASAASSSTSVSNPSASPISSLKTLVWTFKKGDIPHYPRPSYNGTPLTVWQDDQVRRWKDGSVKEAVISFPIDLTANQSKTIDFVDTGSCTSTCGANDDHASSGGSGMSESAMLAFMSGGWNVAAKLTYGASTVSADARSILSDDVAAGKNCGDAGSRCTYWLNGPVVTEMELQGPLSDQAHFADYAMGFDQGHGGNNHPIRPRFGVRAYPAWTSGVRTEVMIFNDLSDRLEALSFDYDVLNGGDLSNTVYSRHGTGCSSLTTCGMTLYVGQAFRKVGWSGSAPPVVNTTNYAVQYKAQSGILPNFDPAITSIDSSAISYYKNLWSGSDHCLHSNSTGNITPNFTSPGGRPEISPTNWWATVALYNPLDMRDIALGMSDCAATMPFHMIDVRTGSAKYCSYSCTTNTSALAFGRFPSPEARPTFVSGAYGANWIFSDSQINSADKITPIYHPTGVQWAMDASHHGDWWYVPYLLSDGDYYYYADLIEWALYLQDENKPGGSSGNTQSSLYHMRWWAVDTGNNSNQPRGYGWHHRSLGNALTLLDQRTAEYEFLSKHWEWDARVQEGAYRITTGNYPPADPTCATYLTNQVLITTAVDDKWCWGAYMLGVRKDNFLVAPLMSNLNTIPIAFGFFRAGTSSGDMISDTETIAGFQPWEMVYALIAAAWNEAREFTYESAVWRAWAKGMMRIGFDPTSNPWNMADFKWPTQRNDGHGTTPPSSVPAKFVQSIDDWLGGFNYDYVGDPSGCKPTLMPTFDPLLLTDWYCKGAWVLGGNHLLQNYAHSARAGIAAWAGLTTTALSDGSTLSGDEAWTWIQQPEAHLSTEVDWTHDPRFAIVPVSGGGSPPATAAPTGLTASFH